VKLLHQLGFVFKKTKLIPSKYDPVAQREFKKKYEKCKNNIKGDEAILFMDGVHPQHNSTCASAWIEKGTVKTIKNNTGRRRISINGVYNSETQETIIHESETINAETTIEFLKKIDEYYKNKSRIIIIVDNARYYKNKKVSEYLENSKLEFWFLPPYSPNLNLIERLWKFLRKRVINNKYYESFKEFKSSILDFFKNTDKYKEEIANFIGQKMQLFDD